MPVFWKIVYARPGLRNFSSNQVILVVFCLIMARIYALFMGLILYSQSGMVKNGVIFAEYYSLDGMELFYIV
ncbi:hypothetical protein BKK49_08850 [Rodentibacter rarus]|nr:hypothetical protein BKK49_08850 [Rodentibacter rarus]